MIKDIHVLTVVISITLFFIRGVWMIQGSSMLRKTWVKIVPHINDTVLLISAILLAASIHQYPFTHGWLTAKLVALVAYIIVGSLALKRGKTKTKRVIFWFIAMAIFVYIVGVAKTHLVLWFY